MSISNLYGREFNPEVIKGVKELNEKIEKEQDPEEQLRLRMQRLLRGMELNGGLATRSFGAYYPY